MKRHAQKMRRSRVAFLVGALLAGPATADELGVGWPSYGGDPGGTRFSRLVQITPQNVGRLTRAWEYRTGTPWRRR